MNNFLIGIRRLIYGFQKQTRETIWQYMDGLATDSDIYSKELKDFCRVKLQAGESQTVTFYITREKLSFYNLHMQKVVEPGEFDVMVGSSSRDIDLLRKTFTVK